MCSFSLINKDISEKGKLRIVWYKGALRLLVFVILASYGWTSTNKTQLTNFPLLKSYINNNMNKLA